MKSLLELLYMEPCTEPVEKSDDTKKNNTFELLVQLCHLLPDQSPIRSFTCLVSLCFIL